MQPSPPSQSMLQIETGHFRVDENYEIFRPNGTHDWLLIYTKSGRGFFGHAGGRLLVARGDVVVLQPKTLHHYGIVREGRPWELYWAHFQPRVEWHDYLRFPEHAPGLLHLQLSDPQLQKRVESSLVRMCRDFLVPYRFARLLCMNALANALLWCDLENPSAAEAPLDARVRRAMERLSQGVAETVSLDDLARHCGLSASRLAHLFREQVGMTPQRFHETQRLNRARQLLEHTDHRIKQISDELGFSDPYYFSVRFKKSVGLSPLAYRRQHGRQGVSSP